MSLSFLPLSLWIAAWTVGAYRYERANHVRYPIVFPALTAFVMAVPGLLGYYAGGVSMNEILVLFCMALSLATVMVLTRSEFREFSPWLAAIYFLIMVVLFGANSYLGYVIGASQCR